MPTRAGRFFEGRMMSVTSTPEVKSVTTYTCDGCGNTQSNGLPDSWSMVKVDRPFQDRVRMDVCDLCALKVAEFIKTIQRR